MMEPTDEQLEVSTRVAWGAYHDTVRRLRSTGGLTLRALELLRRDLRTGGRWAPDHVPEAFRPQAVLLLHDVAADLARARGAGFSAYYVGAGDMLPDAPDDASELDDDRGAGQS